MTARGQQTPPYNGSRWRNTPATTALRLYQGWWWEIRQEGATSAPLRNHGVSGAAASLEINVKGDGGDVKNEESMQRSLQAVGASGEAGS
jgi:hypothetical protein